MKLSYDIRNVWVSSIHGGRDLTIGWRLASMYAEKHSVGEEKSRNNGAARS